MMTGLPPYEAERIKRKLTVLARREWEPEDPLVYSDHLYPVHVAGWDVIVSLQQEGGRMLVLNIVKSPGNP